MYHISKRQKRRNIAAAVRKHMADLLTNETLEERPTNFLDLEEYVEPLANRFVKGCMKTEGSSKNREGSDFGEGYFNDCESDNSEDAHCSRFNDEEQSDDMLQSCIKEWGFNFGISRAALHGLKNILKPHQGTGSLDSRNILNIPSEISVNVENLKNGEYSHMGLTDSLSRKRKSGLSDGQIVANSNRNKISEASLLSSKENKNERPRLKFKNLNLSNMPNCSSNISNSDSLPTSALHNITTNLDDNLHEICVLPLGSPRRNRTPDLSERISTSKQVVTASGPPYSGSSKNHNGCYVLIKKLPTGASTSQTSKRSHNVNNSQDTASSFDNNEDESSISSTIISQDHDNLNMPVTAFSENNCQKILETILQELVTIKSQVKDNAIMLNQLLLERGLQRSKLDIDLLNLPIDSQESFNNLEEFITDKTNQLTLVSYLGRLGGNSIGNTTRRILSTIMSDNLAQKYNWRGHGKMAFKSLSTKDLIISAVRANGGFQDVQESDIEQVIKEWLKHAKTRIANRSTSNKKNTQKPSTIVEHLRPNTEKEDDDEAKRLLSEMF